jgi:1,4-dihydroxy-2-naphthoyl-CoA synthase
LWQQSNLKLPLEFSRISDKGRGRMTLVIDDINGKNNNIWINYCLEPNVNKAINYLKLREQTSKNNIAYINLRTRKYRIPNTSLHIIKKLVQWATKSGVEVIIWTDLKSNWKQIRGMEYNIRDAFDYYESAQHETQIDIMDYVKKATTIAQINTKFSGQFSKYSKL